jgi:hypothetical protein
MEFNCMRVTLEKSLVLDPLKSPLKTGFEKWRGGSLRSLASPGSHILLWFIESVHLIKGSISSMTVPFVISTFRISISVMWKSEFCKIRHLGVFLLVVQLMRVVNLVSFAWMRRHDSPRHSNYWLRSGLTVNYRFGLIVRRKSSKHPSGASYSALGLVQYSSAFRLL